MQYVIQAYHAYYKLFFEQMSCHPEVNEYIQQALQSVRPLMEQMQLDQVALVILNANNKPVERFVFEMAPAENPTLR